MTGLPSSSSRETVKKRASLISRVRAVPSSPLPARPTVSLGRTGTPVPSTSAYSMSGTGSGGGSGITVRARSAVASAAPAALAAAPDASADRSIVLALTAIPARSCTSAAALPNGTSAPARAIISARPGDSDVPATPSCSSRGAGLVTGAALNLRAGVPVIAAGQNGLQQPGAGRGQRGAHRLLQHAEPAPGAAAANQCDHANRQEANGHDQRQNERDDDNE